MRFHGNGSMKITETLFIEDWEFSERFVRASGPGGQNVNKVATAVELRFEAAHSPSLSAPVKAHLRRLAGRRWTADGAIVIQVDETRSQGRNREIARTRLADLIRQAAITPKRRVPTNPPPKSKLNRLKSKRVRGQVKSLRERVREGGDDS